MTKCFIYQNLQCANHRSSPVLHLIYNAKLLCLQTLEGQSSSCDFCIHSTISVADHVPCRTCYTKRGKHAVKDCKITSKITSCFCKIRNNSVNTFKMVIFQVKLSTAFCSFLSFKPSLVPMLCKCSWNSMAERNKKDKVYYFPSNLW